MLSLIALSVASFQKPDLEVAFTKHIVDRRFIAEGVAAGDINRDGKLDILAGNVWYEAPNWKPHEIAPVPTLDPKTQYSNCFHNWAVDLNRDGWQDQILIGMPGEKAIWRENPKGREEPWKEHVIGRSAGNESPHFEDLLGNGRRVLIMGYDDARVAWFEPSKDPYAEWISHDVSELKGPGSQRFSHGMGIGDVNGDGRRDIITTGGYYAAPSDPRGGPWTLAASNLGPDCAHMIPIPGKGRRSILTTSAHARGVWLHSPEGEGYRRSVIDETISGTHAAVLSHLGKPGLPNLITGKRKWAHPPGVDVGSEEPSWLVRYELSRSGVWTRHIIDEDSGVGTQFVVTDMNGDRLPDIVTSNKNGVFVFEQVRPRRAD